MRVYIGWDKREAQAYQVAKNSLSHVSSLQPAPLDIERLSDYGLLQRPVDNRGQTYDIISNAPCSTDFAISRFLVPMLEQSGWALFCDCDVVFLEDPLSLLEIADKDYAVMVVKHGHLSSDRKKMDGQVQTVYPRKNWSSVMLWNCDHPANRRLTLNDVNTRPGRDLHRFYWLHDSEIGELPPEWNWLVNVNPKPENPKIAHFTLGTPNMSESLRMSEHSEIWWDVWRSA